LATGLFPGMPPRTRPDVVGGVAWVVGVTFLLVSFALAFLLAIDIPGMLSAGLPDPQLSLELERDVFGGNVPDWPDVIREIATVLLWVFAAVAVVGLVVARRRSNGLHILRGVVGVIVLVACSGFLYNEIRPRNPWQHGHFGPVNPNHSGWQAVRALLDCFSTPGAGAFVVATAVALMLLVWPRRKRDEAASLDVQKGVAA
jgi:hypothetical protein